MKAARIHRFGTPEVIAVEDVECPSLAPDEVLVHVHAAGVGPWDALIRAGKSVVEQPLPLTLGSDISGTVAALGASVSELHVGQAVYGVTNPRFTDGYAEYAAAKASMLAPMPATVTHVEAASVPVVAVTALQMLFDHGELRRGQRVLIHGAGGNVGAYAVQFALAAGAHVIGTATRRTIDLVRQLGAQEAIDVASTRFEAAVAPVDLVVDTLGGEFTSRSLSVLARGGTLVSAANAKPNQAEAARLGIRAEFILVDVTTAALGRVAALLDGGKLRTHIGQVMPLVDARVAHEMLDGPRPRPAGKLVLDVESSRFGDS